MAEPMKQKEIASRWELIAAGVSALTVGGMIVFLLRQALLGPSVPAAVAVRVIDVSQAGGLYRVEVAATNSGTGTAAALGLEGSLKRDTTIVETSAVTVDYRPGGAERRAVLWFSRDPRQYRIEVRPTGHDLP